MHMGDELLSPEVGLAFLGLSGAALGLAARRLGREQDEGGRLPLVGLMAAFVFAAQMVNFRIPGTGSSGHLGGGTLLAVLLGPHRALPAMAAVLLVQALFFADGGLLAWGCNLFNLGLVGGLGGWWLYRSLAGPDPGPRRRAAAAGCAAWAATVAGSAMVALQTRLSGLADLPLAPFLAAMAGIHALIGVGEGLVTAAAVGFLLRQRPGLFAPEARAPGRLAAGLGLLTLLTAMGLSLLASEAADGLEWSLERLGWAEGSGRGSAVHEAAARVQESTALLPDYRWTSLSGLLGAVLTLLAAAGGLWLFVRRRGNRAGREPKP